jgi:hypothetical protein
LERGYIVAYINLAVALCSIVPSSSLLIIMASLHELRDMPIEGDYFLSFDDLLEVIRDASVKHKFSSQGTTQRLKKSAVSMYQQGLSMACEVVNAYLNSENENEIIVDKVVLEYKLYYSISDAQSKRSAASCQEWIQLPPHRYDRAIAFAPLRMPSSINLSPVR